MLVMMVVFLGVFFGLRYFGPKKQPTPATPAQQQQAQQHQEALQQATTAAVANSAAASVAAEGEQTTTIENAVYRITFTNRGAQVTHWILKDYKDSHGAPLDLVHKTAAAKYGYPLSLYSYDTGVMAKLTTYSLSPTQLTVVSVSCVWGMISRIAASGLAAEVLMATTRPRGASASVRK